MLYIKRRNKFYFKYLTQLRKGKSVYLNHSKLKISPLRCSKCTKQKNKKKVYYNITSHKKKKMHPVLSFIKENSIYNNLLIKNNSILETLSVSFFINILFYFFRKKNYNNYNWFSFLKSLYSEYYSFIHLSKSYIVKNINKDTFSLDNISLISDSVLQYNSYIDIHTSLTTLDYYFNTMNKASYNIMLLKSFDNPIFNYDSFDNTRLFILLYLHISFLWFKHISLFNSNAFISSVLDLKKKHSFLRLYLDAFFSNRVLYCSLDCFFLRKETSLKRTYTFHKVYFSRHVPTKTSVLSISFWDIYLYWYSYSWFSSFYILFLKHIIRYNKYNSFDNKNFFLISLFYDIEFTQYWMFKLIAEKASSFIGYGPFYVTFHFKRPTHIIRDFTLFDHSWSANASYNDLIVQENSLFLRRDYMFIRDKKSFYNYYY